MPRSRQDRVLNKKKRLAFVNWPLLFVVVALLAYGLVVVYFVTSSTTGGLSMVKSQLIGVALGAVFLIAFWRIDYRIFKSAYIPLLVLCVLLMISPRIPGLGVEHKGALSWIAIFGFQFQPSEPGKLFAILAIAGVIAEYNGKIVSGRDFLKVAGLSLLPFAAVMLQPDLGTGLVLIAIAAGMLLVGGLYWKWFAIGGAVAVLLVGGLLALDPVLDKKMGHDVLLKDYQMNRLLVFMDEDRDPQGEGYNLRQAKIAIGSGEVSGKGLGKGTQGSLHFLPEAETDFIFAILGEELGFMGAVLLLALYLALLVIALDIASRAPDLFGTLICAGIISMWTFQILENIGMNLGIMPITGIPLPFMSFGSSFMVTSLGAVGLLLSVWTRRKGVVRSV